MKKTRFLFLLIVNITLFTRVFAQQPKQNESIEEMLKYFYVVHNTIWETTSDPNALKFKLDSLQRIYCTVGFRKVLQKEMKNGGLDHDLLTLDQGTDVKHLSTIKVIKDQAQSDIYLVSYISTTTDEANRPKENKVTLHVKVAKEEGKNKIDRVF